MLALPLRLFQKVFIVQIDCKIIIGLKLAIEVILQKSQRMMDFACLTNTYCLNSQFEIRKCLVVRD
jgi:hypothetical protein